jgi:DNA modification methylase
MNNKVIQGDCLEVLKTLPSESVEAIVTDPPYELGFMGKSWDNTGIANNKEMWKECLRVLKPGGYLLSFGGTRTYHRMASAIEDAGFEVRDMIEWVYGSGFPKSLNIGKAVDKLQGNDREWISKNPNKASEEAEIASAGKSQSGRTTHPDITKGTSEWEGWGTALKPSHEPIVFCRKPLEKGLTIAENCLKWGTGGINIEQSRVEAEPELAKNWERKAPCGFRDGEHTLYGKGELKDGIKDYTPSGRFPANLIHDNSEEVRECFPDTKKMVKEMTGEDIEDVLGNGYEEYECNDTGAGWFEKGGRGKRQKYTDNNTNASRFFKSIIYTAKASKSERNKGCEGLPVKQTVGGGGMNNTEDDVCGKYGSIKSEGHNFHPTVKPIALMEYLIKMVTREGQTVLDPFAGSGTTLIASKKLGRKYIGIELEPEYVKIAEARLSSVPERLL